MVLKANALQTTNDATCPSFRCSVPDYRFGEVNVRARSMFTHRRALCFLSVPLCSRLAADIKPSQFKEQCPHSAIQSGADLSLTTLNFRFEVVVINLLAELRERLAPFLMTDGRSPGVLSVVSM